MHFERAGIQRSRMYWEYRVISENDSSVEEWARWPAMNSAYVQAGMGKQFANPFFMEAKVVAWRYRAVRGYPLMETPLGESHHYRDAVSVSLGVGLKF